MSRFSWVARTPLDRLLFAPFSYPVYGFTASVVVWSFVFSWWLVLVGMIFTVLHELAHARVVRRCCVTVDSVFLTGLMNGTRASLDDVSEDGYATILLAGPVTSAVFVGTLLVLTTMFPAHAAESMTVVYLLSWLTLINMLPALIPPTDGTQFVKLLAGSSSRRAVLFTGLGVILVSSASAKYFLGSHWTYWVLSVVNVLALVQVLWLVLKRPASIVLRGRHTKWYVLAAVLAIIALGASGFALQELTPSGVSDLVFRDSVYSLIGG